MPRFVISSYLLLIGHLMDICITDPGNVYNLRNINDAK